MNKIEKMLKQQSEYKTILLKDYYSTQRDFLVDLKAYLSIHPKKIKELNILKESIINVNSKRDNLFYLDNSTLVSSVYTHNFQMILNAYLKDKDLGYIKAHKLYTASAFASNLARFKKRYINQELYVDMLNDIYSSFNQNRSRKTTYVDLYRSCSHVIDINLIYAIYESGLSAFDYSYYYGIDFGKVNSYCNSNIKNSICEEILNRENKLESRVLEILQKISDEEMDFYDYFKECKIPPQSLRKLASANQMYGKTLSNFITQNSRPIALNEAKELEAKLIINDILISTELKLKAMNEIKDINAPLTVLNYKKMLRRILKDETK